MRFGPYFSKAAMAAAVLATVTACSPYVYGPEIEKFSDGISTLHTAAEAAQTGLEADRLTVDRLKWAMRMDRRLRTVNCLRGQKNCRIVTAVPTAQDKAMQNARTEIDAARDVAKESLRTLSTYAKALQAVTNAADPAALNGAQVQFNSALGGLAKAVNAEAASVAFISVSDLFAYLSATALNYSRFRALEQATSAGHDDITLLGTQIGDHLERLRKARLSELELRTEFLRQDLAAAPNRQVYETRLAALVAATDRIAALQNQSGTALGAAMIAAHAALRDAVADDRGQQAAVFDSIANFHAIASKLEAAIM